MTKMLVTGGAGFIGSNFLDYMVEKYPEYDFVCLDLLTYAGNYQNLCNVIDKDNFKFVKGDINDNELVDKLFEAEKFDYVVNFAAESHVDNSLKNPNLFFETNVLGVMTLLNACRKYGIKRFHQISTDEVYGDLPLNRPDLKFKETSILNPSNPYSASKASAEMICKAYHRSYGIPITISRCTNNYGKRQFPEKLIPMTISKIMYDEKVTLHGDGTNVRDWLLVVDHVTAIDLILHKGKDGEIYNIAGDNEINNITVINTILKKLGKGEEMIEHIADRVGNDLRYALDTTKIEKELGWTRTRDFDEGIEEVINWYIDNKDWIENIKNKTYMDFYAVTN